MKITLSDDFKWHLADILTFIAKDSKERSLKFRNELMVEISKLVLCQKRTAKTAFADYSKKTRQKSVCKDEYNSTMILV